MASDYIAPLNLQYIFQNVFAGNGDLFFALFLVGCAVLAGMFRMSNMIFITLIGLSSMLLYSWYDSGFYATVLLITAMAVFWSIKRIVRT